MKRNKMRMTEAKVTRLYYLILFFINFLIMWLYVFAEDYQAEKFYLSALIICSMVTVVYTVWFFDLLRKKEDEGRGKEKLRRYQNEVRTNL